MSQTFAISNKSPLIRWEKPRVRTRGARYLKVGRPAWRARPARPARRGSEARRALSSELRVTVATATTAQSHPKGAACLSILPPARPECEQRHGQVISESCKDGKTPAHISTPHFCPRCSQCRQSVTANPRPSTTAPLAPPSPPPSLELSTSSRPPLDGAVVNGCECLQIKLPARSLLSRACSVPYTMGPFCSQTARSPSSLVV